MLQSICHVQGVTSLRCSNCYQPHEHIITGYIKIIENAKLREFVSKEPKYREPNKINWKATENMIFKSIDLYAERCAKREQHNLKYLSKWKENLKELVTDRRLV